MIVIIGFVDDYSGLVLVVMMGGGGRVCRTTWL